VDRSNGDVLKQVVAQTNLSTFSDIDVDMGVYTIVGLLIDYYHFIIVVISIDS